jgi:pantoate--beta-alanine ligase
MLADLDLPIDLVALPTVRDDDGLALSSRNVRLTPAARQRACALPSALTTGEPREAREILASAGLEIDYVEVAPFDPPVLAAAVRVDGVRLIDNVPLALPTPSC